MLTREDYPEVTVLRDASKAIAIPVTVRTMPDGEKRFSCAFQREYITKSNEVKRTFWFNREQVMRIRDMIGHIIEVLETEEKKATQNKDNEDRGNV
jgi:hypothetical protein